MGYKLYYIVAIHIVNYGSFKKTLTKQSMLFSTSRTAENVHFLYNGQEIETVTEFNYLGVTFTKNGKFKLAKQKILKKLQKPCMKLSEGEKDIIYQSNAC